MWSRPIKLYGTKAKINHCFANNALQIKKVLKSNLGLGEDVANRILHKHPNIARADPTQVTNSIKMLKSMDLSRAEIASYPLILLRHDYILNDNRRLLMEIGLKDATAYRIHSFQQILNTSVQFNQQFHFLPRHINIFEHIFAFAKVDIKIGDNVRYEQTDSLLKIHIIALVHYLQQRLNWSKEKIVETINRNIFCNGRSIRGIEDSIMIAERAANGALTSEHVQSYCLNLFPEQIKPLFELKTIYGIDILEIICSRPNSIHFPMDRCMKSAQVLQKYMIPEHIVRRYKSLLFRNPGDLADDLELIASIVSDSKYFQHVYFGTLLLHIRRLKMNMEQQKIDFYKTVDERFIDFFLNGFLFKNYSQILPYISSRFNVTLDEAHHAISLHPQWKHVNLAIIDKNIDFLSSHGFTPDDIFRDIHVVLYSSFEIKDILRKLSNPTEANPLGISTDLTKSQTLRLIVYFIEQKCGFNGEGVYISSERTEFDDSESVRMEAIINACLRNRSNINLHDYVDEDKMLMN